MNKMRFHALPWFFLLGTSLAVSRSDASAQALAPGVVSRITFTEDTLPATLHCMWTGTNVPPTLAVRLPDDFDSTKSYPLLVYVPGFDGGVDGNIGNAQTITGPRGWIVASLPLFKKTLDRGEVSGGLLVSQEDAPVISGAYRTMLGRLFALLPNIDPERSAMVGFSNGALTLAVLLSSHDTFLFDHFRNFCLVDHGMFHLTDLHKRGARDCRYLILVGDKEDMGRELKIRGARLLEDEWRLLGVDLTCRLMKNTGHEFGPRQMAMVGAWLRRDETAESLRDYTGSLRPSLAALVVPDVSRSAAWFRENLDFHVDREMTFPRGDSLKILFLKRDESTLELIQKNTSIPITKAVPGYDPENASLQGFAKIEFRTENVSLLAQRLKERGVKILFGPFDDDTFGVRSLIIQDGDGNALQFSEPLVSAKKSP